MAKTRAELILLTVDDLVSKLLWYDRRDDEDLPRGEIEAAIRAGELTVEAIVLHFGRALRRGVGGEDG